MEKNFFKSLVDNYTIKIILGLLGLIGTAITLITFLQKKEINIRYEILANTNVLDFKEDVSKLEVFYDSTNLKLKNENLRIFTIKVINKGNKDLIKEYYDNNDPLGMKISSGQIIESPEIIQSSNEYIGRNIKLTSNRDNITFSPIIMESDEFFIVKLLVLHKTDSIPQLIALGKISGQNKIEVVNSIDTKDESALFIRAFKGSFGVQLMRLFSYSIAFILVLFGIIYVSITITSYYEKKEKERILKEFRNQKSYKYSRLDEVIFEYYKKDKIFHLEDMLSLPKNEEELNSLFKKLSKSRDLDPEEEDTLVLINSMIQDGFIIKNQNKLTYNRIMKTSLNKFMRFLNKNSYNQRPLKPTLEDLNIEEN